MKAHEAISRGARLEGPDQALFTELVYGVTRMRRLIDKRLEPFCNKPLDQALPEIRTVLRLGLYQALFLTRVPGYALTSESVTLVGLLGAPHASGFVNAVLRTLMTAKEQEQLPGPHEASWSPAMRYSHPEWLVNRWAARLETPGPEAPRLEKLLECNNVPHPVYLQVAPEGRDSALEKLKTLGVDAQPVDWPNHTLLVRGPAALWESGHYDAGPWTVQDWTFQAMLDLVPAPLGARVWDVCAAPGGKCAGLSWRVGPEGRVIASDDSPERARILRGNVARLGLANVDVLERDAAQMPTAERFQTVWVDAPCTGTGTLSRRADLRWNVQAQDLARQSARQASLLEAAAGHVYPGGHLAYSTCSLEPEENQDVIKGFLKRRNDFEPVALTLPPFIRGVETSPEGLLFWPTKDRDGGFLALLCRKA